MGPYISTITTSLNSHPDLDHSHLRQLNMEPEFTYIQQMQAENCEAEQPRSKDKEGPTSIEYLLKCPSYDPLKAPAEEVDHILSKRLTFDNDHSTLACFEFRKGDGHTSTDLRPLVTGATFERQDLNAVIL